MKAAQLDRYAKDGRLVVREVPDPEPAANEVLIEVRAAAVNPLELLIASGNIRLIQDYRLPQTLGNECSGVVVKVGSQVRDFCPAMPSILGSRWNVSAPLPNMSRLMRRLWPRCLRGMPSMWRSPSR